MVKSYLSFVSRHMKWRKVQFHSWTSKH